MSITPQQAAKELIVRRAARADILAFAEAIDVPGRSDASDEEIEADNVPIELQPVKLAEHHKMILREMDECSKKVGGRLMLFFPPGSAKSTYASIVFPAFYLGKNRGKKIILASYGDTLAVKMGRRTRSIIKQSRFKGIQQCELMPDSQAVNNFVLTNDSEYMAGGILAGMTGNRADCLLPGTLVDTENGLVTIEHLFDSSFSGNVLSYEHNSKRVVQRRVQAVARRDADSFYRIHSASGRVVEVTGNHRIWTDRGWTEASLLTEGDRLLRALPGRDGAGVIRNGKGCEERIARTVLRPFVPDVELEQGSGATVEESQATAEAKPRSAAAPMRGVQFNFQAAEPCDTWAVLLESLQGQRPRDADDGRVESRVAQRCEPCSPTTPFCPSVSDCATADNRARRLEMCDLPTDGKAACASHRHGRDEQQMAQLGYAMRALSPDLARGGTVETEEDVVVLVEFVRRATPVYDIQVEGTECFFANGILVHNCIIIDDPTKGREQANSDVVQQKTWDAYEDDLKTRLKPGGSLVIIMTRWHEADIAGRILPEGWRGESGDILCKDGNVWRVICVQAECQVDDDPLGRKRGEYLWPEWFTPQHWDQYRHNSRTWSSLYQQLPTPADGDMFKPDMMQTIDVLPAGRIEWVRGWDFASVEAGGDWTAGVRIGRHQDGRFIVADVARAQYGPDKRDKLLLTTTQGDGRGTKQDVPQDPGQAGKSQIVGWGKMLLGYAMLYGPESGDKETRAEGFASQVNVGNVYMLRGDWNAKYREELRGFPNAKWDDQVDASSRAFNRLLEIAAKMRITKTVLDKVRQR